MSETHTAPARVNEPTTRVRASDRLGRAGFDSIKSTFEPTATRTTPHTSIDITWKTKQMSSSVDADLSGAPPPIYQSTPKTAKKTLTDSGNRDHDSSSSSVTIRHEQPYQTRQEATKGHLRDFSQSTSHVVDTTYVSRRTASKHDESNLENVAVETSQSPTKPAQDPSRSILTSESGIFDYSATNSFHQPTSPSSWRQNLSTSILDDTTTRTPDHGLQTDSGITSNSTYDQRQSPDTDQARSRHDNDFMSRSTLQYSVDSNSSEPEHHQQRSARRQVTSSSPTDYEPLANYQSGLNAQAKVSITTQSRSRKPLIVDEIETIETETHIECKIQRTNETEESTSRSARANSAFTAPKKSLSTTSLWPGHTTEESSPSKRVILNDRPQYYESLSTTGKRFRPP